MYLLCTVGSSKAAEIRDGILITAKKKKKLPGVMEGTNRTTAAGNVSMIAMLMQWTRNPTSSLNEPWAEGERQRGTAGVFT